MGRSWRFVVLVAIASVALAGCGGPAPASTPSERPSPTPVPGPTLGAASAVNLTARNVEFNLKTLEVPANAAFVVRFTNADGVDLPHDVDIRRPNGSTIDDQDPIDGQSQIEYVFEPLPPGDYVFICSIHPVPTMTGTLRVR